MEPRLVAGQFCLVDPDREPMPGDVVVARHPSRPLLIIKRLAAIDGQGLTLLSDNADHGTDSRHFGPVRPDAVVGVVVWPTVSPAAGPTG